MTFKLLRVGKLNLTGFAYITSNAKYDSQTSQALLHEDKKVNG